jgi:hypothetical protein
MSVLRVLSALLVLSALGACRSDAITGSPQHDGIFLSKGGQATAARPDTTARRPDGEIRGQGGYVVAY